MPGRSEDILQPTALVSSFFNEYFEAFTPGTLLSFQLTTTNVMDPGGTPDEFTLAILDGMGSEIPTTGVADEFLSVTLPGGAPQVAAFGTAPGAAFSLSAPTAQPQGSGATPEPSMLLLTGVGSVLLGLLRRIAR